MLWIVKLENLRKEGIIMPKNQPLGIELVKRGVVTGQDIEKALKYQETHRTRRIGDILYILKLQNQKD